MSSRYSPPKDLSHYVWLSIGATLAMIALKGVSVWLTGSMGLPSDAVESVVNLIAAVVALIVLKIAVKPADADHQFGHSKTEYSSAAIEGIMVFVAVAVIIIFAIECPIGLRVPEQLGVGLTVSIIALFLNGAVAWVFYRAGRRERSMTPVADAKYLVTDIVTSAAVLVGVALVTVFGSAMLDVAVALGAGPSIMWTGFTLIRDSVSGLIDIAPPAEMLRTVEEALARYHQVGMIDFHAVWVREAGNRRFMELHVLVPAAWSVKKGHDSTEQVIDELIEADISLHIPAHLEPIEDPKSYEDLEDIQEFPGQAGFHHCADMSDLAP